MKSTALSISLGAVSFWGFENGNKEESSQEIDIVT
jgi:hypothetical protein